MGENWTGGVEGGEGQLTAHKLQHVAGFVQDQRSLHLKCCCLNWPSTDIWPYFAHPPKHRLKNCLLRVHNHRLIGWWLSYLYRNLLRYIMDDAEGQDKIKCGKATAHTLIFCTPTRMADDPCFSLFCKFSGGPGLFFCYFLPLSTGVEWDGWARLPLWNDK